MAHSSASNNLSGLCTGGISDDCGSLAAQIGSPTLLAAMSSQDQQKALISLKSFNSFIYCNSL